MHAFDSARPILSTSASGPVRSDWYKRSTTDRSATSLTTGRGADTWSGLEIDSTPPPPESGLMMACRLSLDSVDEMLCSSRDVTDSKYWQGVTHLVYQCLYVDANGCVEMGQPNHALSEILSNPTTYLPVVRKIGLPVVFSMPDYGDPESLMQVFGKQGCNVFLESLSELVNKHSMQYVELDAHLLRVLYEAHVLSGQTDVFHSTIRGLKAKLWLSFNNYHPIWHGLKLVLGDTLDMIVDAVVLRSYGFVKFNRLQTSHGVYQTMNVHPESALRHFESRFDILKDYFPPHKILMDMDTCGVEYLLNERSAVCGFRLIPLHEIRRQKMFSMMDYEESFDAANGCCLLKWPSERRVVSYDNDEVRRKKVDFVRSNELKGFVVGEPRHDLPVSHKDTLLNFIRAFAAA
jgi:hypothetical protein